MKKIKIIPNDKKDKAKAKIIQAMVNGWIKENPQLLEDMNKLAVEVVSFNVKWGTKIEAKDLL